MTPADARRFVLGIIGPSWEISDVGELTYTGTGCPKCAMEHLPAIVGPMQAAFHTMPDGSSYRWDVRAGYAIVAARPRPPIVVHPDVITGELAKWELISEHLAHVEPSQPGLAVMFPYRSYPCVIVMVDGWHRAARNRALGADVRAYVLDLEESARIRMPTDLAALVQHP